MAEKKKKETVQPRGLISTFMNNFDVTAASLIFSILYFPLAVLLLENSTLSNYILLIFTVLMILLGLASIIIFIAVLSNMVDSKEQKVGGLIPIFLVNFLLPLVMFKVYASVIWDLLPDKHEGFMCDLKYFIIDMYRIFQPQTTLNYLILGSIGLISILVVWKLGRK